MIRQIFREANLPQPIEKINQKGTVKWGVENLYAQFLVGLYYDNPIHGGIVNQKIKFITAGGLEATNPVLLENGKGTYDYQEIVEMVCTDAEIFIVQIFEANPNEADRPRYRQAIQRIGTTFER